MKRVLLMYLLSLSLTVYSQEDPIRVGFKLGSPSLVSANFEYCTPLLGGRFAPSIDVSVLPYDLLIPDINTDKYYFELGANYYILKPGEGLYGGISYSYSALRNVIASEYLSDGVEYSNNTTTMTSGHKLNFRIAYLMGKFIYFRPELGFSFNSSLKYEYKYEDLSEGFEPIICEAYVGVNPISLLINLGFGCKF